MQSSCDNGILIYGAGGHALTVRSAILQRGKLRIAGYIVDGDATHPADTGLGASLIRFKDLQGRDDLPRNFIVAIGDNAVRRARTQAMESLGFRPMNVVHPDTTIGEGTTLGRGVYVQAGVVIDPDVVVGDGVIVNVHAGIGHGSRIGPFCHVSAGALVGANCPMGELTFVGMGAIILSGVPVGRNAFVAAGALANKDVPDNTLAIGVPARFRSRELVLGAEELARPHNSAAS